jgi:hypothetical protein
MSYLHVYHGTVVAVSYHYKKSNSSSSHQHATAEKLLILNKTTITHNTILFEIRRYQIS